MSAVMVVCGLALSLSGARPGAAAGSQTVSMATLEQGEVLYRSRCASCHGVDGDEVPAIGVLTGQFRRGRTYTDAELVAVIRNGIPGTAMAPIPIPEADAALVVTYLRWAAGDDEDPVEPATMPDAPEGDAVRGMALYLGKGGCAQCHRIADDGGHLGPALSDVGQRLSSIELAESMTDPDARIRPGTGIARIVTADGTPIVARLLDQDTDVLHVVTQEGRTLTLARATVRHFDVQTTSGMPAYGDILTAAEIADIVSYLRTLGTSER